MFRVIRYSLVFVLGVVIGWATFVFSRYLTPAPPMSAIPTQSRISRKIDSVTLHFDPSHCGFSRCPPSRTLRFANTLVWSGLPNGISSIAGYEIAYTTISVYDFDKLARLVEDQDFFELATRYPIDVGCDNCLRTTLTVTHDNEQTTLVYIGAPNESKLWLIEKAILGLANEADWKNFEK